MFIAKKIKRVQTEEFSDFKFCFVRRRKRCDVEDVVINQRRTGAKRAHLSVKLRNCEK